RISQPSARRDRAIRAGSAGVCVLVLGARPKRSEERAEARDERASDVRAEPAGARRSQPAIGCEMRSSYSLPDGGGGGALCTAMISAVVITSAEGSGTGGSLLFGLASPRPVIFAKKLPTPDLIRAIALGFFAADFAARF